MSLLLRVFAITVLIASVALCVFAYRALVDARSMGTFLGAMAPAYGDSIEPEHGARRWRIQGFGIALAASGSAVAGLLLLRNERRGWIARAASVIVYSLWLAVWRVSEVPQYAFEPDWPDIAVWTGIGLVSLMLAWRWRRPATK